MGKTKIKCKAPDFCKCKNCEAKNKKLTKKNKEFKFLYWDE
jgi:hypothetical protein